MDSIFKQSFLPSSSYKKGPHDRSSFKFIGDILKNIEANLPEEHLKRRDSENCGILTNDITYATKMKPRIVQAVSASVDCISKLMHPHGEQYGRGPLMVQNLPGLAYYAGCPAIVGNDMNSGLGLFGFPVLPQNSSVTSPSTGAYPFNNEYIETSELFYLQNENVNIDLNSKNLLEKPKFSLTKHKLNPEAEEFIPLAVLSQLNNVRDPLLNNFENKNMPVTNNASLNPPTSDFGFIKNDLIEELAKENLYNSNLGNQTIFVETASQVNFFTNPSEVSSISKERQGEESIFSLSTTDIQKQDLEGVQDNYMDKITSESFNHTSFPVNMPVVIGKSLLFVSASNLQENTSNKLNSNLHENTVNKLDFNLENTNKLESFLDSDSHGKTKNILDLDLLANALNELDLDSQENSKNTLDLDSQENPINKFNLDSSDSTKSKFDSDSQENSIKSNSNLMESITNKTNSNLQEISTNKSFSNLPENMNKLDSKMIESVACNLESINETLCQQDGNLLCELACAIDVYLKEEDGDGNLSDSDFEESSDDSSSSEDDSELSDEDDCATEAISDESFIKFGSVESNDSNFILDCTASEVMNPKPAKLTDSIFSLICTSDSGSEDEDSDYDCDLFTVQLDDAWDLGGGLQISAIISHCSPESLSHNNVKAEDFSEVDGFSNICCDYDLIVSECCEHLDEPLINIVSINERWKGEIEKNNKNPRTPTKVKFNDNVEIHPTVMWDRKGLWEQYARDRMRFARRIEETESVLSRVFAPEHRLKIFNKINAKSGTTDTVPALY